MIAPDDVLREMQWFGLVAVVNADFPVDELIEISDALLAAPLPLVAVAATNTHATDAVAALRARHGRNLVIGASHVATAAEVTAFAAAGAQFVFTTAMDVALTDAGRACSVPVVPLCADAAAFHRAREAGCALVLRVLPREDAPVLPADWPPADDAPALLVGGAVSDANIVRIAQSSAAAVALGYEPIAVGRWSAAALITQARAMRAAWEGVRSASGTSAARR